MSEKTAFGNHGDLLNFIEALMPEEKSYILMAAQLTLAFDAKEFMADVSELLDNTSIDNINELVELLKKDNL